MSPIAQRVSAPQATLLRPAVDSPPSRQSQPARPARIPSLDGLRAVSITLVLLAHLSGTAGFPIARADGLGFIDTGNLGVRVFFVISGYLITTLLIRELDRTGTISLRQFYYRRTLRIFPAYYAYVGAIATCWIFGWVSLQHGDLLHAVTYTQNYALSHQSSWYVGHAWSLAVEEQFYILWPATLLLAGRRRGVLVAVAVIAAAPLARVGSAFLPHHGEIGHTFQTVADAIAAGCLLALLRDQLWENGIYRRVLTSSGFLFVPVLVLGAASLGTSTSRIHLGVYHLVGVTVMNLGIALCIDWSLRFSTGRVGRFLNSRPLVFIGTLSYSIYLWQQPFLNRDSGAVTARFPYNLSLAILAALTSYFVVERPTLALRERLQRSRTQAVTPERSAA